jgi:hypothetical protein
MSEWKWETKLTVYCLIMVALIEAGEQALSGSPSLKGVLKDALPAFMVSPKLHYLPLLILVVAGVLWLIGKARNKPSSDSVRQPFSPSKLVIHSASYGTGPDTDLDVTEKLQSMAHDGLVVSVANDLVPRDPHFGVIKQLTVTYSYGN